MYNSEQMLAAERKCKALRRCTGREIAISDVGEHCCFVVPVPRHVRNVPWLRVPCERMTPISAFQPTTCLPVPSVQFRVRPHPGLSRSRTSRDRERVSVGRERRSSSSSASNWPSKLGTSSGPSIKMTSTRLLLLLMLLLLLSLSQ